MNELDDYARGVDRVTEELARDSASEEVEVDTTMDPPPSTSLATVSGDYIEPWTRQPGETDRAWELFKFYRDLGPARTYRQVSDHFDLSHDSIKTNYVYPNDWRNRAAAFDTHMDRIYQLQRAEAVKEMAERHAAQIVEALEALNAPFEVLKERLKDPQFVEDLEKKTPEKLLNLAAKSGRLIPQLMAAERLSRDAPTTIAEVRGEVTHKHELNRDQLAEIFAGLEAAGAFDERRGDSAAQDAIEAEIIEADTGDTDPEADGIPPS